MCANLSVVQSFVSFHLLSLCPPLPTDNTYTLHCVSTCSPVVQFLRVASRCSPTLLTPEVPQPQPTDSSSCRGRGREGAASTDTREHNRTTRQHHVQVRPAMEMCGAVMCEECVCVCNQECGGWVCCVLILQTMLCSQHNIHIVNQHCISFYVLYNARNMFKTVIGCDCYPLLVLRLPNDILFHLELKVARWDPLHQYWTTNSILGVDVNMGGWGWGRVGRQHGWVGWEKTSTWVDGGGRQHGWVRWGWDAYGPRSRGAV